MDSALVSGGVVTIFIVLVGRIPFEEVTVRVRAAQVAINDGALSFLDADLRPLQIFAQGEWLKVWREGER